MVRLGAEQVAPIEKKDCPFMKSFKPFDTVQKQNRKETSMSFYLADVPHGDPMNVEMLDGPHDSPEGVAQAAKLFKRMFSKKEFEGYVMVEVSEVPDTDIEINEQAADDLARLVDGTYAKEYSKAG
jgi:hypothetical protein